MLCLSYNFDTSVVNITYHTAQFTPISTLPSANLSKLVVYADGTLSYPSKALGVRANGNPYL